MKALSWIGLSSVLALVAGCENSIVLHQDSTSPQTFAVGDRFDLELSENGSTGFSWSLEDFDEAVLELTADDFELGSSEPGAAGTRTFSFECVGAGDTKLVAHSARGDEEPGDPVSIDVTCE